MTTGYHHWRGRSSVGKWLTNGSEPTEGKLALGLLWARSRAEIRAKWRTAVLLAIVLGIGSGVALTAFAGARRTNDAVSQFVKYSLPDDGGFLFGKLSSPPLRHGVAPGSLALPPVAQRIVNLPQVVAHFRSPYLFVTTRSTGRTNSDLSVIGDADPDFLRRVDRPMVLSGRLPGPSQPFGVVVNDLAARADRLRVGSTLHLYAYTKAQIAGGALAGAIEQAPPAPKGPSFTVRVAAIVRFPQDVSAVAPLEAQAGVSYESDRNLYVTPAFLRKLASETDTSVQQIQDINLVSVRLRDGAGDWGAFAARATAIGKNAVFVSPGNVFGVPAAAASAQRGIHLDVVALLLFGALVALVTVVLVGQAVARQTVLQAEDYAELRVLGGTRAQIVGIVVLRSGLIGLAGAFLGVAIAWLASPLTPVGLARQAEIHPGFAFDSVIVIPGAIALGALISAWSILPAWRMAARPIMAPADGGLPVRGSGVPGLAWKTGLSPAAAVGTWFALQPGRGRSSAPVVMPMLSAALSVAVLGAALTFGTSLGHLVSSPTQQGWNWDVLIGNPNDLHDRIAQDGRLLATNPYVAAYSAIAILASQDQGTATIDGKSVPTLLAIDPLKGEVYPPLLQGHQPEADNQIVLGTQTLDRLHKRVGQSVAVPTPEGRLTLDIVGRMIVPSIGDLFSNALGDGGWVYGPAVLKQQAQQRAQPAGGSNATPPTVFNMFAVRYARGVSPTAAYISLRRQFGSVVLRQLPSEDVLNIQNVDRLPLVLAGLVTLLGLATIGNSLFTSVRRRRRDLAILKAIGFGPRQVAAVVGWQATTFAAVSLIVGIPIGIIAGGWAWTVVASSIGSSSPPQIPALVIALMVPATIVFCNLIAAAPGWAAARIPPAVVMRSD